MTGGNIWLRSSTLRFRFTIDGQPRIVELFFPFIVAGGAVRVENLNGRVELDEGFSGRFVLRHWVMEVTLF